MSSSAYYDEYVATQVRSGINERIHALYRKTCRAGLRSASTVLEVGCGIGALTFLLSTKVKKGIIEAIDISPKSAEYANAHIRRPNISITAADILTFNPAAASFDFILLFDVIEHIPLEKHPALFQRISQWMTNESLLLINIPNPQYILFDQKNNPAALQEIDQPVYLDKLTAALSASLLDIRHFETHSVWVRDDYQFMVIKKRKDFEERLLSNERSFVMKVIHWVKRKVRTRLKYRG